MILDLGSFTRRGDGGMGEPYRKSRGCKIRKEAVEDRWSIGLSSMGSDRPVDSDSS